MFAGARRHDLEDPRAAAAGLPTAGRLHAVHDRYLVEIVEQLGLCPFARRSREQGRVHRPLQHVLRDDDDQLASSTARWLQSIVATHDDAEILLPTFVFARAHRHHDAESFAGFVSQLRLAYDDTGAPGFFMVAFHPGFAPPATPHRRSSPETLVPLLRRTPDPVIQCVRIDVLERARVVAQQSAMTRLRDRFAGDTVMLAMLERSVQADSELSAEIARTNFDAVGAGDGRAELERRIASILTERAAL
ncbi:MAG: DUF1415 family protein [Deltaproteobacteria bacterium]|nr:DUF1415 family protein [Deltaproteobacteria bacterium]MBK8241156.1 DUF1415 family protein [Deltaproteobacteria bacterium]MBK8716920.1 DUF1415 family protein [Deltaproteobacteria bacterium]MBP7287024.1 DUF1415 family protein [Nannocystaceae bacterium]